MFNMNGNFSGDATTATIQSRILNGERGLSNSTVASKLRDPMEPLILGSGALAMNLIIVDGLEDKLLKYMFALRDSISSGTNKHNTEVATFNQLAAEMVLYKIKRFRNNQYTNFFRRHVSKVVDGIEDIEIKFQVSDIERFKVQSMDPNVANAKPNIVKNNKPTKK